MSEAIPTEFNEPIVAGPYITFDGSIIIEFLQPDPSRNASVLFRSTYKHDHPWCKWGKGHPQTPPYHIHFNQTEHCQVLKGRVGATFGYECLDQVFTTGETIVIKPWIPHTIWHHPDNGEDTTVLLWFTPDGVDKGMDRTWFENIMSYDSDATEGKITADPLQIMLFADASAMALVWLPNWRILGPLRWFVPWSIQATLARFAALFCYQQVLQKYTDAAMWEAYQLNKKSL